MQELIAAVSFVMAVAAAPLVPGSFPFSRRF